MTNNQHGQVPEALIDLIDAYAETRHRCGGIYNAKTEAARKAVIEALSEVQALSAAPAIGDELRDTLVAVSAAIAERDDRAAQKMICEILAASTTPPAEQQAQPGAVYAELPQPDSWFHFTAQFWENKLRDFADRTHALRMQAAPKAAPGEREQAAQRLRELADIPQNDVTDPFHPRYIEGYKAGHAAGRKRAAPQQEAQEPCQTCTALARTVMLDQVSFDRKPDCYGIRQITDDEGVEEWEDIRTSPDVAREEANDMMATGRGEIYEVVPLWATPQLAPQPAPAELERLRERIARMGLDVDRAMRGHVNEQSPLGTQRLAAIAALVKPAPAPLSDDDAKDAARWRWLRENWFTMTSSYQRRITFKVGGPRWSDITEEELDAAIDAARKQGASHD